MYKMAPHLALAISLLVTAPNLVAQIPAVTSVLNGGASEAKLSPGVVAEVSYTPLAPSDLQHSFPNIDYWPSHETMFVQVGGWKAWVLGVRAAADSAGGIATILVPREAAAGLSKLVLTNSRGSSAPFAIILDQYSPALTNAWSACRGGPQIVYLNAIGLGPSDPPTSTFARWTPGQSYTTMARPSVTVAGVEAEVQASMAYPWLYGYQVTFQTPATVEEGLQPVVLTIGGAVSNSINVLVGTENQLAAGAKRSVAAPESIVTANGCPFALATGDFTADPSNPPTTLGGTTVQIADFSGETRLGALFSVSRNQVSYMVPAGTANGKAIVTITAGDGTVSHSALEISTVEPGVFCAPNLVCGWAPVVPQGYVVRVRDGIETNEPILPWTNSDEPLAIDLGPDTDEVYLVILGTGFRNRSSLANVSVTIANVDTSVEYAGPQGEYAGLDQVKVRLRKAPRRRAFGGG